MTWQRRAPAIGRRRRKKKQENNWAILELSRSISNEKETRYNKIKN